MNGHLIRSWTIKLTYQTIIRWWEHHAIICLEPSFSPTGNGAGIHYGSKQWLRSHTSMPGNSTRFPKQTNFRSLLSSKNKRRRNKMFIWDETNVWLNLRECKRIYRKTNLPLGFTREKTQRMKRNPLHLATMYSIWRECTRFG